MKKQKLLLFAVAFVFSSFVFGQNVVFTDNFDAYTAGTQLVTQNSTDWDTWSGGGGTGEDPFVSAVQAQSPLNSVNVITNNDLVKIFGDGVNHYTSGAHIISFNMFVPTGSDAYWNVMQDFYLGSYVWGMDVFYDAGVGTLTAENNVAAATFAYAYDTVNRVNPLGFFGIVHSFAPILTGVGSGLRSRPSYFRQCFTCTRQNWGLYPLYSQSSHSFIFFSFSYFLHRFEIDKDIAHRRNTLQDRPQHLLTDLMAFGYGM